MVHIGAALDASRRIAPGPDRDLIELLSQVELGGCLMAIEGLSSEAAAVAFARAQQLCRTLGHRPEIARVMWGLSLAYLQQGRIAEAEDLLRRLLERNSTGTQDDLTCETRVLLGITLLFRGELAAALREIDEGSRLCEPSTNKRAIQIVGFDPEVVAHGYCAQIFRLNGRIDDAGVEARRAISLAQR
jgi:tetratricopeptide (TPR) repeat protein